MGFMGNIRAKLNNSVKGSTSLKNPIRMKRITGAVDVGQAWIKIARVERLKKGVKLLQMSGEHTPEKTEELGDRIRDFWRNLGLDEKEISATVSGDSSIIKILDISGEEWDDEEEWIKGKISDSVPFDINDIYFDYQKLKGMGEDTDSKLIIVASKRKEVEEQIKTLHSAGLKPVVLDLESLAVCNCFVHNYPDYEDEGAYLLNIGAGHSTLCVHSGREPLFIQDLDVGVKQLQEKQANALEITVGKMMEIHEERIWDLHQEQQKKISQIKREVYDEWAREVEKTINFYLTSSQGAEEKPRMFISGGGCMLPDLVDYMGKRLRVKTRSLNSLRRLILPKDSDHELMDTIAPQFAVAIGLALRKVR